LSTTTAGSFRWLMWLSSSMPSLAARGPAGGRAHSPLAFGGVLLHLIGPPWPPSRAIPVFANLLVGWAFDL
jgi:hypothetical protein